MADEYPKTIILPRSHRTAVIQRELTFRDMRMAERVVGARADSMQRSAAMICQVLLIDGKPIVMEDFDDLKLLDVTALFQALDLSVPDADDGEGKKNSLTPPLPPNLSNGGSRPLN